MENFLEMCCVHVVLFDLVVGQDQSVKKATAAHLGGEIQTIIQYGCVSSRIYTRIGRKQYEKTD